MLIGQIMLVKDNAHGSISLKICDDKENTVFPNLPEEMILEIRKRLTVKDRKNLKLICRSWLNRFTEAAFVKDQVLVVDYYNLHEYVSPRVANVSKVRIYANGCEREPVVSPTKAFFLQHKDNVKHVHLIFHRFWQKALIDIFKYWPQVEHLVIGQRDCSIDFNECRTASLGSPCPDDCHRKAHVPATSVRKLEFYTVKCQHIIKCITNSVDNITSINAARIGLKDDTEIPFFSFIANQGVSMEELVISDTRDFSPSVKGSNLLQCISDRATNLSLLGGLGALDGWIAVEVFERFVNVRKISLDLSGYFGDHLATVLSTKPALTHVYLCVSVFYNLSALNSLENLTCLVLDSTLKYKVTTDGSMHTGKLCNFLKSIFSRSPWPNLKCLRVYHHSEFNLPTLAPYFPNIQILEMPDTFISTNILTALNRHNRKLQYLSLSVFRGNVVQGMGDTPCSFSNLTHFEMHENSRFYKYTNDFELTMAVFSSIYVVLNTLGSENIRMMLLPLNYIRGFIGDHSRLQVLFSRFRGLECVVSRHKASTGFDSYSRLGKGITRDYLTSLEGVVCDTAWDELPVFVKR